MKILLILCFILTSTVFTSKSFNALAQDDYWNHSRLGQFKRDTNHPDTCVVPKAPLPTVVCGPNSVADEFVKKHGNIYNINNICNQQLRRGVFNDVLNSKGVSIGKEQLTMSCFIFPEGPRCCNYCPAQFSRFCPMD